MTTGTVDLQLVGKSRQAGRLRTQRIRTRTAGLGGVIAAINVMFYMLYRITSNSWQFIVSRSVSRFCLPCARLHRHRRVYHPCFLLYWGHQVVNEPLHAQQTNLNSYNLQFAAVRES